jgi:predicted outer membrane lipoprotein
MAWLLGETGAGAFIIMKLMGYGTVTVSQRRAQAQWPRPIPLKKLQAF